MTPDPPDAAALPRRYWLESRVSRCQAENCRREARFGLYSGNLATEDRNTWTQEEGRYCTPCAKAMLRRLTKEGGP